MLTQHAAKQNGLTHRKLLQSWDDSDLPLIEGHADSGETRVATHRKLLQDWDDSDLPLIEGDADSGEILITYEFEKGETCKCACVFECNVLGISCEAVRILLEDPPLLTLTCDEQHTSSHYLFEGQCPAMVLQTT